MHRPPRPAANDARAASGPAMGPTRDLFAELDAAAPAAPTPVPVPVPMSVPTTALAEPAPASTAMDTPAHHASTAEADRQAPEPRIPYAEAQRLMAIGRAQGPDALTPEQHHAIWDCLLELPESQAWLSAQLTALQGELQERGLRPWSDLPTARAGDL
ncbi:hypothetical protein [Comamonas aquatica]|uniref:hypothetical protein n=1 Tax=Comamonas aquatica TaxID=225991 RepID=UPI0034D6BB8C